MKSKNTRKTKKTRTNHRLTPREVKSIRKEYYTKLETQGFLAKKYKTVQSVISDIVNYKIWRSVE